MNTQVLARQNSSVRSPSYVAAAIATARKARTRLGYAAEWLLAALEKSRAAQARRFIRDHRDLIGK